MRATQHFHRGLLLATTQWKEKKFRETHWDIFGVFGFYLEGNKLKKEKKTRKTIYTGELPTSKRRTRKSFWVFFLNTTTNYPRKKNKKEAGNILFFCNFSKFFKHTRRRRENKLTWIIQWKSVNTDSSHEMWTWI